MRANGLAAKAPRAPAMTATASAAMALAALASTSLLGMAAASAADLYDVPPRAAYDDPRYRDMYAHPAPPGRYEQRHDDRAYAASPGYDDRWREPGRHAARDDYGYDGRDRGALDRYVDRHGATTYDAPYEEVPRYSRTNRGYLRPMPTMPRFGEPLRNGPRSACLRRGEIVETLRADGWQDLYDFERRGRLALIKARRPSGQAYEVQLDRCTGQILRAEPLDSAFARPDRAGNRWYPGSRAY